MKELIVCPKCKKPTVKMEKIYSSEAIKETSLDEFAKKELTNERHRGEAVYSGDSAISFSIQKATQLLFKCTTCGYVEVHNV